MRPYHIGYRWIDLDHILMIEEMDLESARERGYWGVTVHVAFRNEPLLLPIGMKDPNARYVTDCYRAPIMGEEEAVADYYAFLETWKIGPAP